MNDMSLVTGVPINADLEHWAQSVLDANQKGISGGPDYVDRDAERKEAADALGHFPSEANATRLKRLLNDQAVTVGDRAGVEIYFVRQIAYESLERMGVKVPEPVLRKEVVRP
jgi:HEAT repeat protein